MQREIQMTDFTPSSDSGASSNRVGLSRAGSLFHQDELSPRKGLSPHADWLPRVPTPSAETWPQFVNSIDSSRSPALDK